MPKIVPGYVPTFKTVKKESSVLDIQCFPKEVAACHLDLKEVQKLKSYAVVALFCACETGIFGHAARCVLFENLPDTVSTNYWNEYEKEYGQQSDLSEHEDECDLEASEDSHGGDTGASEDSHRAVTEVSEDSHGDDTVASEFSVSEDFNFPGHSSDTNSPEFGQFLDYLSELSSGDDSDL